MNAKEKTGQSPQGFQMEFFKRGWRCFELHASQEVLLPVEETFAFFEDPRNLFSITPPWLDFRMRDPGRCAVFESAEFDYTIRWFGVRIPWRSRIEQYRPPHEFTDLQIKGPYRGWRHIHRFEPTDTGTRLCDTVCFELPLFSIPLFPGIIRPHLAAIFRFRAERIREWSEGRFDPEKAFRIAYCDEVGSDSRPGHHHGSSEKRWEKGRVGRPVVRGQGPGGAV